MVSFFLFFITVYTTDVQTAVIKTQQPRKYVKWTEWFGIKIWVNTKKKYIVFD